MRVTIIGTGFVGVVSSAVFAHLGNDVIGLDIDPKKVESLKKGKVPFFEPGLEKLLVEQQKTGNLKFTTSYPEAISEAEVVLIAVGTPSASDGQADLTYVFAAAESLAPHLKPGTIVAIKSTVPPGTLSTLETIIKKHTSVPFDTAALPEFLREGRAVEDTLKPDRVVIGTSLPSVFAKLAKLHEPLTKHIIHVSPSSAQMGKYAANAYLATRITFINQIADLCEKNGANVNEVIQVIGQDSRIGKHYWYPGFGYGGSCFPKDVKELAAYSRSVGEGDNLFNKINQLNETRISKLLNYYATLVNGWSGKSVAVLGLSFKPQTDDMREAPSTKVIPHILEQGARVTAFDPASVAVATYFLPQHENLTLTDSITDAIQDANVIIALIEWPEITSFTFPAVTKPVLFIDARNQFDQASLTKLGYRYQGVGS